MTSLVRTYLPGRSPGALNGRDIQARALPPAAIPAMYPPIAEGHSVIDRILIRNFKSLHEVAVELGPFTVLVCKNGAGKTSFLQALQMVSWLVRFRSINDALEKHELSYGQLRRTPPRQGVNVRESGPVFSSRGTQKAMPHQLSPIRRRSGQRDCPLAQAVGGGPQWA